ncbi:glycosyl transferase [Bradyrhizobium sp. UFLA03-84]|uniref:glycosyltransferase family 2 protein n=1 Tax=Bradyrhizobium sp. UFLA03-84 TaxID=418599 RepID=UPI000BADDF3A|nr:glycosyltransferase family 2 protein [Bradyrhizobium sp. UFLA03-84]PAY06779.1 glycosyl transferase [Bradyrhizobium sp. UFLA03-84]
MTLTILNLLIGLVSMLLTIVTLSFAAQAAAMIFIDDHPFTASPCCAAVAVLVPAHDEEQHIEATLCRIASDLAPGDRLLVVADNCTDRTALLAAKAGAEVLIRTDLERRGKGFALAAGLGELTSAPPDVVVIIDADCQISGSGVALLAQACQATGAPIQCLDLMIARPDSPAPPRLAEFAWRIKNDFRPRGYARLGLPCQLLGTGMALPWALINQELFATGHLAEDLFLGLELAISGHPPRFLRDVRVTSYFPDTQRGQAQQKRRWIHGHLGLIRTHLPRIALHVFRTRDLRLLALAADLLVPPIGILALANIAVLIVSLLYLVLIGPSVALTCVALEFFVFAFSLVSAWFVSGRDLIGLREFAQVPLHLMMVAYSAFAFLCGHRTRWVRADRLRATAQFTRTPHGAED